MQFVRISGTRTRYTILLVLVLYNVVCSTLKYNFCISRIASFHEEPVQFQKIEQASFFLAVVETKAVDC